MIWTITLLLDNPNIRGNLLKVQGERENLIELLRATIEELKEENSFNVLVSHVEDAKLKRKHLLELEQHERELTTNVDRLKKEVDSEQKGRVLFYICLLFLIFVSIYTIE